MITFTPPLTANPPHSNPTVSVSMALPTHSFRSRRDRIREPDVAVPTPVPTANLFASISLVFSVTGELAVGEIFGLTYLGDPVIYLGELVTYAP